MNIFAKGVKLNLLFATKKGTANMHDLFILREGTIKDMANALNRSLKQADDLFAVVSAEESNNKLRLAILLEVLEIREAEVSDVVSAAEKSQKLKKVRARIASKKEEAEGELSLEQLQAKEKELLAQ